MNSATRLLLAPTTEAWEARVRASFDDTLNGELKSWGDETLGEGDATAMLAAIEDHGAGVVVLGPGLESEPALEIASTLDRERPDLCVLLVADPTPELYRQYIEASRAEFSVAKNVYVATRSGWFSGRSACYLAAGLPVVVQDTGFSELLPTGEGLLCFSSLQQAAEAIAAVERDYDMHKEAARDVARKHFDSDKVLGELLRRCGVC